MSAVSVTVLRSTLSRFTVHPQLNFTVLFYFKIQRLVLQHRPCTSDKECASWRYWNTSVADSFAAALSKRFKNQKVCYFLFCSFSFFNFFFVSVVRKKPIVLGSMSKASTVGCIFCYTMVLYYTTYHLSV